MRIIPSGITSTPASVPTSEAPETAKALAAAQSEVTALKSEVQDLRAAHADILRKLKEMGEAIAQKPEPKIELESLSEVVVERNPRPVPVETVPPNSVAADSPALLAHETPIAEMTVNATSREIKAAPPPDPLFLKMWSLVNSKHRR